MSLGRVISEQQAKIDHLERLISSQNKSAQAQFVQVRDLFSAMERYMRSSAVMIKALETSANGERIEAERRRLWQDRDALRRAADACGYCWRCEHYGCVCSDCECD